MYSNVLVPIDQSIRTDQRCIREAEKITKPSGTIHCLYVKLKSVEGSVPDDEQLPNPMEQIEEMTNDYQQNFVYESVTGTPAEDIASYADRNDIDAIVMNTYKYDRSGIERLLTSSVTDETIEKTGLPVLVLSDEGEK